MPTNKDQPARPIGYVDYLEGHVVHGWATDPKATPAVVEFFVNHKLVGAALADRSRADLTEYAAAGRAAFAFPLPTLPGRQLVEARHQSTHTLLANGSFYAGNSTEKQGVARWLLRCPILCPETVRIKGPVATIIGWIAVLAEDREIQIIVNSRVAQVELSPPDAYLMGHFEMPSGVVVRRFQAIVKIESAYRHLEIGIGYNGRIIDALRNAYYPLTPAIFPESERQRRIQGASNDEAYALQGYTLAQQIRRLAVDHKASDGPILDWGCGCARVAQFIGHPSLYGCDIDADNIAWCQKHIVGKFSTIAPREPTAYPDNYFDIVYGVSVFTHLDTIHELFWLQELCRITKPGGLVMVSTLGAVAALRSGQLSLFCHDQIERGPIDAGRNPDIDGVVSDPEYYRNVFHTHRHIYCVWGQWFAVEQIYEGIIGNHQDMVVMRKPKVG